jgi:hypothetical protein
MKAFFARLFNLFTIVATLSFFVGVITMGMSEGGGQKSTFFIFMAIWFGLIAGLNYLVLGKPTLWNDKQD